MATLVPQDSFILENKNPEQMVIALTRAAELLIMGSKSVARGGIVINIDQNGDVSIDSNLVLENGNQPGKPLGEEGTQYALRNPIDLDRAGGYYVRHVCAMTREGMHLKSKIAAELAWRDMEIDRLKALFASHPAADACSQCGPQGVFATDGSGPFDCYNCGKKAASQGGAA